MGNMQCTLVARLKKNAKNTRDGIVQQRAVEYKSIDYAKPQRI